MRMCNDEAPMQHKQKTVPWAEVKETKDAEETVEAEEEAVAHLGQDIVRTIDTERPVQILNRN